MKLLVMRAMSITKSVAEDFVTMQLPQVLDNVVKIFLFTSSTTRKVWMNEISDKHIGPISECVNNVKTKKGHLSKEILERLWCERLELRVRASMKHRLRDQKYLKMTRTQITEQSVTLLIHELLEYKTIFSTKILIDEIETGDSISGDLYNIAVSCSDGGK